MCPSQVKVPLRRDLPTTLDVIRTLAQKPKRYPSASRPLAWWMKVAEAAGVSEGALRRAQAVEARRSVGAEAVGCSWFKCARFGRRCEPATFYRCHRCQQNMYCGLMCQTRYECPSSFLRCDSQRIPAKGLGRGSPQVRVQVKASAGAGVWVEGHPFKTQSNAAYFQETWD